MRSVAAAALAIAALGITRALPEHGVGLWLRLGAATVVLLIPGAFVTRAVRMRGAAATLAWTLAALTLALGSTFVVHGSLWLALVLLGAIALAALPFALRHSEPSPSLAWLAVLGVGIAFGVALWWLAGALQDDALFHLGRVRKLNDFGALSLRSVDEFRDGGLHPGYAFPLWHGLLALVARLAGVDPTSVLQHEASILCPLTFLVVYEAGVAVFRAAWMGLAVLAGQVALTGLAPGHGGAYVSLALPATAARQLLVFVLLSLFFAYAAAPGWNSALSVAAAATGLALVHPTYVIFVLILLAGAVGARTLLVRSELRPSVVGLAAVALPGAAVAVWLAPFVRETASHTPSSAELGRALNRYGSYLVVSSNDRYHLAPQVFSRTGAVAVAALLLVPAAAFAARRRWAALVLGGSLLLFALELIPFLFPRFADTVSLSQARRAAGFLPLAFALAGGVAVLAPMLRIAVLPVALAAGIVLQIVYPGDFTGDLSQGLPSWPTWVAVAGGALGLLIATVRPFGASERRGPPAALAVMLFVLPVAVHGFSHWSVRRAHDPHALTPNLVTFLRTKVPERAVIFSDLGTSYEISAYAPVYVAAAPPAHVADTPPNRPYVRRRDVAEFYATGRLAIPRRYHAGWLVIDRTRPHPAISSPIAYRDSRFTVFRL